jgi:hypothetical protein
VSGHASAIWAKIKLAIAASTGFGTEVTVWLREELDSDELVRSEINVFVTQENEKQDPTPYVSDFRAYRVRVTLRFEVDGRSGAAFSVDSVMESKSTYNDALQTAIRTTMAGQTYAPDNVYTLEYVGTDWNYKETGKPYGESNAQVYRISQLWDYHTYES